MTLYELSRLVNLNKEIAMYERQLHKLEINAEPGAARLDGMPRGSGVADKVGDYAVKIADLKAMLTDMRRRRIEEQIRIEKYIDTIGDSYIRMICTYRFVYGFSWKKTAWNIGGGNTGDGCRKAVKRYLERH